MAYTQEQLKAMLAEARANGTYKPGYIKNIVAAENRKDENKKGTVTGHSGVKITTYDRKPLINPETGRENTSEDVAGLNYYEDPRSPSAGKEGFYYDREGNFKKGTMPENYYYNDYLGAMVEGESGSRKSEGSPLSLGGGMMAPTAGKQGDSVFHSPFGDDGQVYNLSLIHI